MNAKLLMAEEITTLDAADLLDEVETLRAERYALSKDLRRAVERIAELEMAVDSLASAYMGNGVHTLS